LLLDAFKEIQDDIELWIFGSGDMHEELTAMSLTNPSIKYFGKVEREIVLKYELSATLLVNLRNPDEELTKYSFPSKTMEYMSSGTPLLTTKLSGIPEVYFKYCFTIDNYCLDTLKEQLTFILSLDDQTRYKMGLDASSFVTSHKSFGVQSALLYKLLNV
jgi:glycosyltransferase involved in cell wall biosynthesis